MILLSPENNRFYLIDDSSIFVGRIRYGNIFPGRDVELLQPPLQLHHVVHGDGDVRDDLFQKSDIWYLLYIPNSWYA